MEIHSEWVNVAVGDGSTMRTYVAKPEGAPRAALLVFPEIFGINAHIRNVAERFAQQGYIAMAPELFHRSGPGFEAGYTPPEIAEGRGHMMKVTPAGMDADILAAFAYGKAAGENLPVAAAGFCMGGRVAFRAASLVPIACGISFYGGGIAPGPHGPGILETIPALQATMLFLWGGKDTHIPASSVDQITAAMRASGKPFTEVEFSEADHGFFCDRRPSYHAASAAVAWPMVLAFLENHTTRAAGA